MTSPLTTLSPDTRDHVLSFLPLTDCLRYSQVCREALPETLPSLQHRRDQQFGSRHAYQPINPKKLMPAQEIASLENNNQGFLAQPNVDKEEWVLLPSVAERLEGLYRALPQSHEGKDMARELLMDVQGEQEEDSEDMPPALWGDHFHGALARLRSITKAHRLHNSLLKAATLTCLPSDATISRATFAVSLDQYMGDVLIATYLMGHSIAGLVEGPTTYSKWTKAVAYNNNATQTSVDGYRQWIYMHSTLLRMLPLKPEWMQGMKLAPICGTKGQYSSLNSQDDQQSPTTEYIAPPSPFWETIQTTETLKGLTFQQCWSHSTRMDDFGPLGPAFRGRDRVRTLEILPGGILKHLGMFASFCRMLPPGEGPNETMVKVWLDQSPAETSFLYTTSKECYRNRPMTVQPPVVTISERID